MIIQKGYRGKLSDHVDINSEIEVEMSIDGGAVYDYCCFGVDENNKLTDDRYMVFYNCKSSPEDEIRYTPGTNSAKFNIRLFHLPQKINKLVFTVSIDGNSTMSKIASHNISIGQNGSRAMELSLQGSDFFSEKAIISIEIYKKDIWRFAFVANGFNGGIGELLKHYGGEEAAPKQPEPLSNTSGRSYTIPPKTITEAMPPPIQPIHNPVTPPPIQPIHNPVTPPPIQPLNNPVQSGSGGKVELRKGQKVNLEKRGATLGEVLINLNWDQPKSFLSTLFSAGIDLDLGCLYELKDGRKGCVQALGNTFGSLDYAPYIRLDGDDRTGASANGENMRINGLAISKIRRILVYTFIYEGAANWKQAKGVVTIKCPGSQEVIVRMDEYGSYQKMCAIALLENVRDETFSIEKLIQFFSGQKEMDGAFGWGMDWVPGRK